MKTSTPHIHSLAPTKSTSQCNAHRRCSSSIKHLHIKATPLETVSHQSVKRAQAHVCTCSRGVLNKTNSFPHKWGLMCSFVGNHWLGRHARHLTKSVQHANIVKSSKTQTCSKGGEAKSPLIRPLLARLELNGVRHRHYSNTILHQGRATSSAKATPRVK